MKLKEPTTEHNLIISIKKFESVERIVPRMTFLAHEINKLEYKDAIWLHTSE